MDKLKPLADGTTTVQMKLQLEEFLTEVISKVCFSFFVGGGGGLFCFFWRRSRILIICKNNLCWKFSYYNIFGLAYQMYDIKL